MTSAELDDGAVEREPAASNDGGVAVQARDGVFTWDDEETEAGRKEVLRGIDLEIKSGKLAAVVGMVGSGKSSLLGCILGEMRKVSGKVSRVQSSSSTTTSLVFCRQQLAYIRTYVVRIDR